MRTETTITNVYQWAELPEDVKQKAIQKLWDFNVSDRDWWDSTYDDAENIGLKITGFDLDRASYVEGNFILSASEVAANIFRDHGEICETYKTAEKFMAEWQPIFNKYLDENDPLYESRECEDSLQDIEADFLQSLLEYYRIMLQHEYDYLTSEEAIIESIKANGYEFTIDGKIY